MKLNNKVDRLELNSITSKEHLIVRFDADLEFCDNKKENKATFYVEFDENGNIFKFPDIKVTSDNPMRYISLAKTVEEVLSYQGCRAKSAYDKAIDIKNEYTTKRKNFIIENNYNDLLIRDANMGTNIHDALCKVKHAKKLKDKESIQKNANTLIEERKLLNENKIAPLELELTRIELQKADAISQLTL